jgi:hypothetical protein
MGPKEKNAQVKYGVSLDLQSLFGLLCTAVLRPRNSPLPLPPRIWAHIRGRYWSAKIETTSLCKPLEKNGKEGRLARPWIYILHKGTVSQDFFKRPPC